MAFASVSLSRRRARVRARNAHSDNTHTHTHTYTHTHIYTPHKKNRTGAKRLAHANTCLLFVLFRISPILHIHSCFFATYK